MSRGALVAILSLLAASVAVGLIVGRADATSDHEVQAAADTARLLSAQDAEQAPFDSARERGRSAGVTAGRKAGRQAGARAGKRAGAREAKRRKDEQAAAAQAAAAAEAIVVPEQVITTNCPPTTEPNTSGGCEPYSELDGQVEPKINDPRCYTPAAPPECY